MKNWLIADIWRTFCMLPISVIICLLFGIFDLEILSFMRNESEAVFNILVVTADDSFIIPGWWYYQFLVLCFVQFTTLNVQSNSDFLQGSVPHYYITWFKRALSEVHSEHLTLG